MNVKQSYFDFLQEQGAKEKVQKIINDGIEKWKQQPAYEYEPSVDPYTGDYSGQVHRIWDKTVGDICKTDEEVLKAYSGNSEATYTSRCGLSYNKVAEEIDFDLNQFFGSIFYDFCRHYGKELVEEFDLDCPLPLSDDDISCVVYDAVMDAVIEGLAFKWMESQFPEYIYDNEYSGPEMIFNVHD